MFTAGSHAHTCSHTPLTPRGGRQRCRQRPRSEAHHPLPRGQDSSLLSEPASVCSSGGTRPWRPSVPRFATVLLLPRAAPWLPPSPAVSAESCLWPELSPPSPPHCGALVHLSIHCLETTELRHQPASRDFFLTTSQASPSVDRHSHACRTPLTAGHRHADWGFPLRLKSGSVSSSFTSQGLAKTMMP